MSWWVWLLLGFSLLVLELLTPSGFFLFFFGLGALIVGLLVLAGALPMLSLQWVLFAAISAALLVFCRDFLIPFTGPRTGKTDSDSLEGVEFVLTELLAPGAESRAELRGTTWSVKNCGNSPLVAGTRVKVVRVNGLTLEVE